LRVATCVVRETERVADQLWCPVAVFGSPKRRLEKAFGGCFWALTVGNAGTVPCVAKFIVTLQYTEYRMILSSVLRVLSVDVIIFQNVSLLYCSSVCYSVIFSNLQSLVHTTQSQGDREQDVVPSHWPGWLSVALDWIPVARISLAIHQLAIPSRQDQYRCGLKPLSQEVKKRHTTVGARDTARWSCSTGPRRVYLRLRCYTGETSAGERAADMTVDCAGKRTTIGLEDHRK
jgi:hypothetical protein